MKHFYLFILLGLFMAVSCRDSSQKTLVQENFEFADRQLTHAFTEVEQAVAAEPDENKARREERKWGELVSPRSIKDDGTLFVVTPRDWTCGFFPGELWYMYEYTQDPKWLDHARKFTEPLEQEKTHAGTHDMGFKMYCSFGNGLRLTGDERYKDILMESARTLSTRYNPEVGAIRSWDHNREVWEFPVIIDNMMNLELLFWAFRESGDPTFYDIAVNHAHTTVKNHFRPDYSTWHVIDYDQSTGEVRNRHTHQGHGDETTWSRGQAWAIYGFTMCYRETGLSEFLEQARGAVNFVFTNPNLPEDLIPYWDYNAPNIPDEPRDASAAAIMASALYELSELSASGDPEESALYKNRADRIVESLSGSGYRAEIGTNRGFLLMHGSGSGTYEVDRPLVYADYYFMEALLRKHKLESGQKS